MLTQIFVRYCRSKTGGGHVAPTRHFEQVSNGAHDVHVLDLRGLAVLDELQVALNKGRETISSCSKVYVRLGN